MVVSASAAQIWFSIGPPRSFNSEVGHVPGTLYLFLLKLTVKDRKLKQISRTFRLNAISRVAMDATDKKMKAMVVEKENGKVCFPFAWHLNTELFFHRFARSRLRRS